MEKNLRYNMNKHEKIRELKKELSNIQKEPWGGGKTAYDVVMGILSILEDECVGEVCCGQYETCENACVPRANYFKENSRAELNKLALSILRESFKDKSYRLSWEANIAMAFYDAYDKNSLTYNEYDHRNNGAKLFMDRLFGEIE